MQDGGVGGVDDCYFYGAGQRFPYLGAPCFCYVVFFFEGAGWGEDLAAFGVAGSCLYFGASFHDDGVDVHTP